MDPSRPHDKYFRSVFSNPENAASLLRAYVPEALARHDDLPTDRTFDLLYLGSALSTSGTIEVLEEEPDSE